MHRISNRIVACAAVLFSIAGCASGATPAGGPQPPPTGTSAERGSAQAVATILVPPKAAKSGAQRRRAWVSPSSQAIQIAAIRSDGSAQFTAQALTPTTNGCAKQSDGSTLCRVPFEAPVTGIGQTDEFQVTLADTYPPGPGYNLSYGDSKGNAVASGVTNNFSLVLGGVIGGISANGSYSGTVFVGIPNDVTIPLAFVDADSNPITGIFDAPATVTLGGTDAGSFTITQPAPVNGVASIADPTKLPGQSIVIHYDGTGVANNTATVTVSSNSPETVADFGQQQTFVATLTVSAGG